MRILNRYLAYLFLGILCLCGINACAIFYDMWMTTTPTPPNYVSPLVVDNTFEISGRFVVKQPNKNSYGNFTWSRTAKIEVLNLTTPIGQTVAKITTESGITTLALKGHTYTGDGLNSLLKQHLGFPLPIKYIHYWIQGIPVPSIPTSKMLSDGFIQGGWKIEYLAWQDPNHPRIIKCENGSLLIKLLINW